jgi:ADP-ribosylation factor-like protein 4
VGGQDKVRPLWRTYTKGAEAIIFVVDSSDRDSMDEAKMELAQIAKFPEVSRLPILVLANKQDLPGAIDGQELNKIFNLKDLNGSRISRIMCACAITGDGLDEALECLWEIIVKSRKTNKTKR